jgi:AcrR family transcriptional regulator/DNA-binding MarR family transcriptional regulator
VLAGSRVGELQRARLLSALFEVAATHGAANATVAQAVERAGVSRRTFYEVFDDLEDAFLAAFEFALERAAMVVVPAFESQRSWRERVRDGLVALLCFLDVEPAAGRMLVVESLSAGPQVLARRNEVVELLTRVVDEGRVRPRLSVSPLTAEMIVGGALTVISTRMLEQESRAQGSLVELASSLMGTIILPYLGGAAAKSELARPLPPTPVHHDGDRGTLVSDPFKQAGMRLTYRTVRVLTAVLAHPGASNGAIGRAADVEDQGQISKLLSRLERIGLIVNMGSGAGKGLPNAWSLTERGEQVAERIQTHTNGFD